MAKVIDYYLFMISPWAYLGGPRLQEIAQRHDAEIRVKPIDLSVGFPATGGVPFARSWSVKARTERGSAG